MISFQDLEHWHVVDNLPSYGIGGRYRSLIYGQNLSDVVITGKGDHRYLFNFKYHLLLLLIN